MNPTVTIYPVSSMTKVFHTRRPAVGETKGRMLLNETYTFQIAVEGGERGVHGAMLRFGGDLAERIAYYPVRDIVANYDLSVTPDQDDYIDLSDDRMYPELCEETITFDVAPGEYRGLVVTVSGAPCAGHYEIPVVLTVDDEPCGATTYTLDVLNASLPESDLIVTHWMHCDCIAELHGVPIFSDEFYRIFDHYLTAFVELGNTMLLVPTVTPALDTAVGAERMTAQLVDVHVDGSSYTFGFERLDRYLDFALEHGIRYFEIAHLFTQWGAAFCPKIVDTDGRKLFGWETASDSPEYRAFLTAYLPALTAHLKARGLGGRFFYHLSDEPQEAHLDTYEAHYRFVKPLIGDVETIDALSHYEFYERGVVDLPVCITNTAHAFRDHGVRHMSYYCCGPRSRYESNRFFTMPADRIRPIGMQVYVNGCVGFLHWGYNFYHTQFSRSVLDPYTDTAAGGGFPSGDSFIVYPDVARGGVQKSLRFHVLRDAFQDYRALKLLESYVGREAVVELLRVYGVYGYHANPHSAPLMHAVREAVNEAIAAQLA